MLWLTLVIATLALSYVYFTMKRYKQILDFIIGEAEELESTAAGLESELEEENKQKEEDVARATACKAEIKANKARIPELKSNIDGANKVQQTLLIQKQGKKLDQAKQDSRG